MLPLVLVVIFRATIATLDPEYASSAARLRELAFSEFGCLDFSSLAEGTEEIAVSYWPDEARLLAWKQHLEHRAAQAKGRSTWYRSYKVEIARVERSYAWPAAQPSAAPASAEQIVRSV